MSRKVITPYFLYEYFMMTLRTNITVIRVKLKTKKFLSP